MSFYSQKNSPEYCYTHSQTKSSIVVLFHKFYDQSNVKSATRSWKHKFGAIVHKENS